MDIKIIYEDSDLVVIDKPSGITVNRSDTTKEEETIQDFAEKYLKILNPKSEIQNKSQTRNYKNQNSLEFRNSNLEFYARAGVVHRLDKETSGLLIIAKNPSSFVSLQKQFKERIVKKAYVALVHGEVKPEEGVINVPVGRLPFNRKRFGIVAGGREANTAYRVISNFKYQISNERLSLLEVKPKTGRTHQIRVHLKYFGHPVFSDPLYAGRKTARSDRKLLPRLFLHASKISFVHPATGLRVSFESELPLDLRNFLSALPKVSI